MSKSLLLILVLLIIRVADVQSNGEELPLCPVNIQYFPQNLPMHCRMPPGVVPPGLNKPPSQENHGNTKPITAPPDYNSPPPNLMPQPLPFPMPAGFPGPIPLVAGPPPPQKLPVIVMPFYSPDPAFKKKNRPKPRPPRPPQYDPYYSDSDTYTDTDTSGASSSDDYSDTDYDSSSSSSGKDEGFWRHRRGMRKRQRSLKRRNKGQKGRKGKKHRKHRSKAHQRMNTRRSLQPNDQGPEQLTPLIQYVTKNGYVIYEKQISKNEANDWLNAGETKTRNEEKKTISFKELDEINKRYPGDGTGDAGLSEAELEKNKMDLEKEVKKVEQELVPQHLRTAPQEHDTKEIKPEKAKKWKKIRSKSRKEKFAEKIGVDVDSL